jgi:hypothetical protein
MILPDRPHRQRRPGAAAWVGYRFRTARAAFVPLTNMNSGVAWNNSRAKVLKADFSVPTSLAL